ncbi:MAG: class I SAM-dependent methyltransferase, partial [Chloroflexi bacterium]|nr:class I SAM-dependent methyltransferase [Chloroflexota bacterium]
LYDLREAPMELFIGRWRRRLWGKIPPGSRVLEIGVGTGKNLRWYPPGVSVVAVDFSPRMLSRAVRRVRKGGVDVQLALMDAQALALAGGSFDVVVSTCVFCSVPDPVLGLEEVRRVLRPDGRILLLEHVRSRLPVLGRLMDWVNPVSVRLQGANINRDTVGNVQKAGLSTRRVDNLFLDIVKLIDGAPASARPAP